MHKLVWQLFGCVNDDDDDDYEAADADIAAIWYCITGKPIQYENHPVTKPASQPPNCNPKSQTKSRWQFSPLGGRRQEPSALYQLPNISPIQPRKRTAIGHRLCGTAPPEIEHCNWWNNLLRWHFWLPSILGTGRQAETDADGNRVVDGRQMPGLLPRPLLHCTSATTVLIYLSTIYIYGVTAASMIWFDFLR